MNNKDYIDKILQILYTAIKQNNRTLSENEIYRYLTRFGVDDNQYGSSISDIRENIVSYVESYIYKIGTPDKEKFSDLKRYRIKNQDGHKKVAFTHMNVSFKGNVEAPSRDVIKLYIPLNVEGLEYNLKMLYNFMLENKINFQSKVSDDVRCDLFVVRVDNKDDANKIISFCDKIPSIKGNLGYCNPFVLTVEGIGAAQDTYGLSYNGFLAAVIEAYLSESYRSDASKCDFSSFQQFVNNETNKYSTNDSLRGSKYQFMYETLARNMEAIEKNKNPLDLIDTSYIKYDHALFTRYKRYMDKTNNYLYEDLKTGKFLTFESEEWIKLQAMNFLSKIYERENEKKPNSDFKIGEELSSYCLSIIDMYRDGNIMPNPSSYQDPKLDDLYPFFYAYLTMTKRNGSVADALKMSNVIKDTMIKTNDKQEKAYKNISFVSNIPIINVGNASIGIELLDGNDANIKGLCNISVIKDGKITKYNNVFIDLDYSLLYPNDSNKEFASIYRASIGQLLSDLERNKRMMDTRDGHFGVLKYDEQKGLKKYQNPEYISKMAEYRKNGLVPDKYLEESPMTK